jgi:hypothetical protein
MNCKKGNKLWYFIGAQKCPPMYGENNFDSADDYQDDAAE